MIKSLPINESHSSGCRHRDCYLASKCWLKLFSTCCSINSLIIIFTGRFDLPDVPFTMIMVGPGFTGAGPFPLEATAFDTRDFIMGDTQVVLQNSSHHYHAQPWQICSSAEFRNGSFSRLPKLTRNSERRESGIIWHLCGEFRYKSFNTITDSLQLPALFVRHLRGIQTLMIPWLTKHAWGFGRQMPTRVPNCHGFPKFKNIFPDSPNYCSEFPAW